MKLKSLLRLAPYGLAALAAAAATPVPDDGLLLHFPFAGNALDSTPSGNDATLYGAQFSTDNLGRTNSALRFNGTGDYLKTKAPLPDTQSIAVSLWLALDSWVQRNNWTAPQVIFFEGDDGGGHDVACYVLGGFHFTVKSDDTLSYGSWLPPLHAWTHLVCQADALDKTMSIWIDGKKVAEKPFVTGANAGFHSAFNLGRRPGVYNDWFFAGSIDEVRVYDHALTGQEIGAIYASQRGQVQAVKIEVESVRLAMNVAPGNSYILQSSTDLSSWTNYGAPFVATAAEYQASVNAVESGRFWRLVQVPR